MKRTPESSDVAGSLAAWRDLAPLMAALRSQAGGAGSPEATDQEAASLADAPPNDEKLRRLLEDPALRRGVASVLRLGVAQPERAAATRRPFRFARFGGLAMAAGIAALLLIRPTQMPVPAAHRAPPAATALALRLEPVASIQEQSPSLAWNAVSGADLYEVEITDRDGRAVFSHTTADTAFDVPAAALAGGVVYFARVRARIESDRWVASDFHEFTIRP